MAGVDMEIDAASICAHSKSGSSNRGRRGVFV